MKFIPLELSGAYLIETKVFSDDRGSFFESFRGDEFAAATGCNDAFVQDDHSISNQGVLRGLHYQIEHAQGKIIRVVVGEIHDVILDIRRSSPTCGRTLALRLSAQGRTALFIPKGFAHGFLTLSPTAEVLYKVTDFYAPQHQRCIRWDDPTLRIEWPSNHQPLLSERDAQGTRFDQAELFD